MERIFKIKTKSNKLPRSQFPSERRYSASMVIGLGVVFFQLFLYSVLMGTLIIHKMTVQPCVDQNNTDASEIITDMPIKLDTNDSNTILVQMLKLQEKVDTDLNVILQKNNEMILQKNSQNNIDLPVLMCTGCFLMALGFFLAFGTGVLAWKHWYIDHNITIFFLASCFSTLTAAVGLLLSILTCLNLDFDYNTFTYEVSRISPITFSLVMNIIILSTIGLIWSFLASKVAYVGMKSNYPDDMILGQGGRVLEVNIKQKGSKQCTVFPQDIIDHFPSGEKLAKYLPKKENTNLPKLESSLEYQQRVNKFLSEVPENTVKNCND